MRDNDQNQGLVIVYTGDGKGKTTAALGLCLRAVGHGNKVLLIQFIKSNWGYGEIEGLKRLAPEVEIAVMGVGCIGIMGDVKPIEEHHNATGKALERSREAIQSGKYDIVILDEINIAVKYGLLSIDDATALLAERPPGVTLVLTGRYADPRIIEAADLVTEMREIKHPFQQGKLSRKGIDY